MTIAREPRSTYRLQITAGFTLDNAARWVDYLAALGADWCYLSPLLEAEPGSDHGYDVIDHSRTDASRGGRAGLQALSAAAHAAGLGVLVDIVPNHVGVASPMLSAWWRDVLTFGRESTWARAFDIDWDTGRGPDHGKIVIPVLGDGSNEIEAVRLDLDSDDGAVLRYYEHAFPVAPGTARPGDSAADVLERQHYRLANFRLADTELNYRRFFAVTTLAGIRVEDPEVFEASHAEIRRWIESGWVDGLRVDHPDGLADPEGYLAALADVSGGRYTVVEKILEPGEDLPAEWRCDGTTGYDALALVDRVLVHPRAAAPLADLDSALRGSVAAWPEMVHDSKLAVAEGILGSEVRRLVRLLPHAAANEAATERRIVAVAELFANFDVYRTYQPAADAELPAALARARARRPDLGAEFDVIEPAARETGSEFAVRLQQTSGAVMAKGVEDGAFYRYPRLTSLTEVGGDPSVFSVSPVEFHTANEQRLATWPQSMTTLSTHDTKRGEDVRARIDALAEIAPEWAEALPRWIARTEFPDPVFANLLLQTAVGAWPLSADRLHAYAEKAAREAGISTGWIDPDAEFEAAMHRLVDACYDDTIGPELAAIADRIRPGGWSNSLAAKLIQLTMPGVPDVYRGTELWRNDLVDPDNRRPFDAFEPGGAADLLARLDSGWQPPVDDTGAAKLLVTSRALRARRDQPERFTGYAPVMVTGAAAEHALGFDRGGAVTVATRLPLSLERAGGWADTGLHLTPGRWRDALTGRVARGRGAAGDDVVLNVAELLDRYPVALLLRD